MPGARLPCTAAAAAASGTAGASVSALAASGCKHGEANTSVAANKARVAGSARAARLPCSSCEVAAALTGPPRPYDLRASLNGTARLDLQREGRLEQEASVFALAAAVQRLLHIIMRLCLRACPPEAAATPAGGILTDVADVQRDDI